MKDNEEKPWDKMEDPVEKPGIHDGQYFTHPAYGLVSVSKSQGQTHLFGTDFRHNNFIRLEIHQAELHRSLSRDWFHPTTEFIEIWLSEAQWASLVSSFNVSPGTPCTIRRVNGEYRPQFPFRQAVSHFAKEIKKKVTNAIERTQNLAMAIKDGDLGKGLSKAKSEAILGHLAMVEQDLNQNLPFVENSFNKHMEKTIEHAKVEVNAYATSVIRQVGLDALAGKLPIQLGSGKEKPYEVFDMENDSHGKFASLEEAKGCVSFDGLVFYTITGPGGAIAEEHLSPEKAALLHPGQG